MAKAVGKSEVSPGEYVQFSASNIDHPFILTGTDMSERFGKWKKPGLDAFRPGQDNFRSGALRFLYPGRFYYD